MAMEKREGDRQKENMFRQKDLGKSQALFFWIELIEISLGLN